VAFSLPKATVKLVQKLQKSGQTVTLSRDQTRPDATRAGQTLVDPWPEDPVLAYSSRLLACSLRLYSIFGQSRLFLARCPWHLPIRGPWPHKATFVN